MNNLISVILPTYARNESGLLEKAIQSVLKQTYSTFELLVVDDNSTDGSSDTIARYACLDKRVQHIRLKERLGLPALSTARAFLQSKGDYIAWQFDDCEWTEEHLETLMERIIKTPSLGLVYGKCMVQGQESYEVGSPFDLKSLNKGWNFIPNVATLIPRKVYEDLGWVDPNVALKRCNDLDMWQRISNKYLVAFIDKVIAIERGSFLSDSLGNAVSQYTELATQFMNLDRSQYLKVDNYRNWNPYKFIENYTDDLLDKFLKISLEHILATERYQDLCYLKPLLPLSNGRILERTDKDSATFFTWLASYSQKEYRKVTSELNNKIIAQQRYIDEQQRYIDEQQGYIDNQQRYIDKLSCMHLSEPETQTSLT